MIEKKLTEIVGKQLGISADTIKVSDRLVDDLGADSLDVVELVMEVEKEFGIEIEDEEYNDLQTVAEIGQLIKVKVEELR